MVRAGWAPVPASGSLRHPIARRTSAAPCPSVQFAAIRRRCSRCRPRLHERDNLHVHRSLSAAGQVVYSVVARNAAGPSAPASITVSLEVAGAVATYTVHAGAHVAKPIRRSSISSVVLAVTCDKGRRQLHAATAARARYICIRARNDAGPHRYPVFVRMFRRGLKSGRR